MLGRGGDVRWVERASPAAAAMTQRLRMSLLLPALWGGDAEVRTKWEGGGGGGGSRGLLRLVGGGANAIAAEGPLHASTSRR